MLGAADAHPAHATTATATAAAVGADASRDPEALLRRESLAHAMAELNRLAALPWGTEAVAATASSGGGDAGGAADSPRASHPPPMYALHSVHSYSVQSTQGDVVRRVPVYRPVRGWDEKRRRPVLYQTLVHEERLQRTVVDTSATMHLVLRRRAAGERAEERAKESECVASSEDPSCALPPDQQPDPSTLLHAVMSVATDYEGHRATTMLRSASSEELERWWGSLIAREGDGATRTTLATAQQQSLRAHAAYLRPIQARLQGQPPYGSLSTDAPIPPAAQGAAGSVTVMSVNIWNFNYWQHRKDMIASVVRASSPDLIGFQEVRALKSGSDGTRRSPPVSRWQVSDLAAMLPLFEYIYAPAMGFREGGGEFVHEGLAIFSRWPLTETRAVGLSRDPTDGHDFHQRICLRARASTPWGGVHILTTHLSLSKAARLRTLPEVGAVASALLPEPAIIVGDFNAVYDEGPHVLANRPWGFRDAWQRLHGDSEEARRKGFTFHAWDHRSRIDFVFYNSREEEGQEQDRQDGGVSGGTAGAALGGGHPTSPSLRPTAMSVVGSEGVSIAHAPLPPIGGVADMKDTMFPSDHLFLAATFRVTPNRNTDTATVPTTTAAAPSASASAASGMPLELKDEL